MDEARPRVFEFLPLTIRLDTLGGVATPLVLRGTPLPATRCDVFTTAEDDQTTVEIALSLGESPLVQGNRRVGSFQLTGIPPAKREEPNVRVEYEVDERCAVTARARLEGADLLAEERFEPPNELTEAFIGAVLADAETSRDADEIALRRIEATNRAKKLIASAEQRLARGRNGAISEATATLGLGMASGESDAIREASDSLERLLARSADPFASDVLGSLFGGASPLFGASPAMEATRRQSRPNPSPSDHETELTSSSHAPALGKVFGGGTFTLDTQLCFVLMPFDDEFQPLYEDHIRPAIERAGLRCERADEILGASVITWDIWERVNRSRLLVAELTHRNANVFYELGLAHAISKDVVLLTQSMDFVPFDLKALRCIRYDFTPRGVRVLEDCLGTTIQSLMKTG